MTNTIKPEKMPGFTQTHSRIPTLGPCAIVTAHGTVQSEEVPGLTTLLINRGEGESSIAVLVYMPALDGEQIGMGVLTQLNANGARNVAASLLKLANDIAPQETN